eukprot:11943210-Prorocentrum_lima.AAC.1
MTSSLVGSEMCIRDRTINEEQMDFYNYQVAEMTKQYQRATQVLGHRHQAVSYTHLTLPTICSV